MSRGGSINNKSIIKTILSVSGIVILVKITAFIKQIITADAFGATIKTDMIALASGLVTNIDFLLISSMSAAFIPMYMQLSQEKNINEREKFVSDVIGVFILSTLGLAMIFYISAPIISRILAPSYSGELSYQLMVYIRMFSPVIFISVEMSIFNALLKANRKFIPGELIGLNQSLILIIMVFLFGVKWGADVLVYACYSYTIFNLIFLISMSKRYWNIGVGNPFSNPHIKKFLLMMFPLLLGYSVVFVNQQVDKIIVSGFGAGTVTAMNYAAILSNFIVAFIGSVATVLYTHITRLIVEDRDKEAAKLVTESIIHFITVCIPITIITVFNASDIVDLVFARGEFDKVAVENCAFALMGYSVMFVSFAMRELYSGFQYGYGDSQKPMKNSTIAIVINILFSIILSRFWGVLGVTLATSISVTVCSILNFYSSKKKNIYITWMPYIAQIPRWLFGSSICIVISLVIQNYVNLAFPWVRLIVITLLSFICYGVINANIIKTMIKEFRI